MLLLPQTATLPQPLAAAAAMTLLLLQLQPQAVRNNNPNQLPTYSRWFLEPLQPPTTELRAKCFYHPTNAPFTTTKDNTLADSFKRIILRQPSERQSC